MSELKQDAQRVLFSVTPRDGSEALSRIREALELYLRLPDVQGFDEEARAHSSIAVYQLNATIHHLKAQLNLASATMQAKDAAIDALQLSNYQYQQTFIGKPRERDLPLIGDTVSLKPYEGKIF